jgi:hypothetical protein
MKNNYLLSLKSLLSASVLFLATGVFAQTNPTPQAIPYFEDFSGLTHASTTYPTGLQGWKVSSAATTVVITSGPTADHTLTANSSASSNSGGVHNYNGKIGTLASGSTNPGLVLAMNTTGYNNITLSYDIMVIRNPYDGASNTRLNEATLQYRIGTTGAFTTLTGVEYQSGTTQQTTSGVTTPQDLQARSIVLPVACENQAEIQIRWITHDMTGAGSRPSFAIDNINVDADNDGDTFLSAVDCNDNDAAIYPGATEICNFIDDDCNTITDDGITYLAVYDDLDGDTYGAGLAANYCTFPGVGYSLDNLDCDDSNIAINPAANEICNGVDDRDADGDTYGNAAVTTTTCDGAPIGYVIDDEDCDDSDLSINPGATEICNAMDEDCDGIADDGLTFVTYYKDNDGDGYGAGLYGTVTTCDGAPATYVDNDLDCEDFNATINPAADDVCNFIDDNCSGAADEGLPIFTFYLDADGDTYGNPGATLEACGPFGVMWVENSEDCDDADADVHPGVIDECNGIDNDCDGNIDDDALFTTYYLDNDGDTYGDNLDAGTTFCYVPAAPYVLDNTDCNDANNTAYPGAAELCDGIDNDCDGSTDEDLVTASVSPAGPTVLCKGDFIELTANAGPGYMYQWYKNGNLIPGATSITYNTNKSGYFQVEVSLAGGCSVLSATHGISVIAKPNANITAPNGTSLCASVKLKASYGGGYSWQWYLDGSPIPGANDYLYFPTVAGSYACRVTNASGCSRNTPAIAVTACKEGELVDGVITETFDIYPNPTIGEFVIDMTLNTTATSADMQLLNIMGEIVYNNSVSVNNGSIIESIQLNDNVPSGMYIVKVVVDGTEYTKQLVLQK